MFPLFAFSLDFVFVGCRSLCMLYHLHYLLFTLRIVLLNSTSDNDMICLNSVDNGLFNFSKLNIKSKETCYVRKY